MFPFPSPGTTNPVRLQGEALHAAGGVGCDLVTTVDAVTWLQPVAGAVDHRFAPPANSAFVGVALHS
ncbi:MAG: hypothetical protein FJX72_13750 [Armatimonadetes bacterium]|nr:hypothetical protein [Armatimonadota bacterium]